MPKNNLRDPNALVWWIAIILASNMHQDPLLPLPMFFVEQYTFGLNRQILKRLCPKMIYVIPVHLSGELQSFARQICIKIPCYPYPMFFVQQYTFGINHQMLKRLCSKIIYVILMHLCGELQSSSLQICIRIPCYPSPIFFVEQYTFGLDRQILKRLCPKMIYVILVHLSGELQSFARQICIRIPRYPYPMFFVQQYTFGINRQILKRLCPKII